MNETLYIVMPTYNEEENIQNVISSWYPMLELAGDKSKLVVSDGGSTDATLDMLYAIQKDYPKLVILPRPGTDHGTKVMILYQYAIENGADWIFQTDSDGQTSAAEFPAFWELRKKYEAVIGNRTKRGDGAGRKFVENVLRAYLLFFFGRNVPDANAPFRLMKSRIVEKYMHLMKDGFALPNAILTECFVKYNEKVTFREVTFKPRQGGKNYMNWRRIFMIGYHSIFDFWKVGKNMKKFGKGIQR